MHTLLRSARAIAAGAALLTTALAVAVPSASQAAPLTISASSGATVTFNTDKLLAGSSSTQRLTFTGAGFFGTSPGAGRGLPVFAIKFDDNDSLVDWGPLGAGGAPDENDAVQFKIVDEPVVAAFETASDGKVSGWIDLPANIAKRGPAEGVNDGRHWLRVLSGAFSTTGVNTNADKNVTVPVSEKLFIDAVDPLTTGFTNAVPTFFPGSIVPAAPGTLTVKGVGYPANAAVTVTLDGTPLTATNLGGQAALTSGADGQFTAAVTLTPGAPGAKTLTLASGAVSHDVAITRVAQTAAHVTAQTVRPGGTVVVTGSGFRGITGAGQKVGLILQPGDKLLGCSQADATGAVTISGKVPTDETAGAKSLFVAAGANCVTGGPVVDPMPRLTQLTGATGLTVSATAPVLTSPFVLGAVGSALPISAEGFAAGESVSVKLDGTTVGVPLIATADGKISGTVAIPAATSLGQHLITLVSNATATPTGTVALAFKATAAAKATLTSSATVVQGEKATFTLAGFQRGDGTAGQKVGVKIDAGAIVECVQADLDGNGSGSITVPAETEVGEHTLRFLAGSSCVSGTANDLPSRSLPLTIQVTAPAPQPTPAVPAPTPNVAIPTPAPVPTPVATLAPLPLAPTASKVRSTGKGTSIEITLAAAASGTSVKIGAKTKAKIKLTGKSKAKTVTVASTKTVKATKGKTPKVVLKLSADGKKLLKARRSLKIVITIQVAGRTTVTKTFTLKA